MLACHNSVFLLFVVDWFVFASGLLAKFQKKWTASSVIFAGVLNLSQGLFIKICYPFTHTVRMVVIGTPVSIWFKLNMVLYISLGGCIRNKTALHAYLGRMQYCKSLVILIRSTLFNWVMHFSFANVFFPNKFLHIRQSLSRFVQCGSRKGMQLLF